MEISQSYQTVHIWAGKGGGAVTAVHARVDLNIQGKGNVMIDDCIRFLFCCYSQQQGVGFFFHFFKKKKEECR